MARRRRDFFCSLPPCPLVSCSHLSVYFVFWFVAVDFDSFQFSFPAFEWSLSRVSSSQSELQHTSPGSDRFTGLPRRSSFIPTANHRFVREVARECATFVFIDLEEFPQILSGFYSGEMSDIKPQPRTEHHQATGEFQSFSNQCSAAVQHRRQASETDLGQTRVWRLVSSWAWPIKLEVVKITGPLRVLDIKPKLLRKASANLNLLYLDPPFQSTGPVSGCTCILHRRKTAQPFLRSFPWKFGYAGDSAKPRSDSSFPLVNSLVLLSRHKITFGRGLHPLLVSLSLQDWIDHHPIDLNPPSILRSAQFVLQIQIFLMIRFFDMSGRGLQPYLDSTLKLCLCGDILEILEKCPHTLAPCATLASADLHYLDLKGPFVSASSFKKRAMLPTSSLLRERSIPPSSLLRERSFPPSSLLRERSIPPSSLFRERTFPPFSLSLRGKLCSISKARDRSTSFTVLSSCVAVHTGPEDATDLVSMRIGGKRVFSSSQVKVTMGLASSSSVKVMLSSVEEFGLKTAVTSLLGLVSLHISPDILSSFLKLVSLSLLLALCMFLALLYAFGLDSIKLLYLVIV